MTQKNRFQRPQTDRVFDGLAHRFKDSIYGNLKGRIRLEVLNRDFAAHGLDARSGRRLRVLDAGGGVGQFSCQLASKGAEVVLAEPSQDMLELARAHQSEFAPDANVEYLQQRVQDLDPQLGEFDLVLFHAVLEWLVEPQETLKRLLRFVRPGGHVSLLFYNKQSLILRHLTLGNFHYIENNHLAGVGKRTLTPISPQLPEEVRTWFRGWGYEECCYSGVRCFHDLMPAHERARCEDDDIVRLELAHSQQSPYRELARYIHLLGKKTDTVSV